MSAAGKPTTDELLVIALVNAGIAVGIVHYALGGPWWATYIAWSVEQIVACARRIEKRLRRG